MVSSPCPHHQHTTSLLTPALALPPAPPPAPRPSPPCNCSERDQERLRFLYEEWAHPYFVSKEEYGRIMQVGVGGWAGGRVVGGWVGGWLLGVWGGGWALRFALALPATGTMCVAELARLSRPAKHPTARQEPTSNQAAINQTYLRRLTRALCLPLLQGTGKLEQVEVADWTAPTIDSWRHSIWVGVWDPWIVVFKVGGRIIVWWWGGVMG